MTHVNHRSIQALALGLVLGVGLSTASAKSGDDTFKQQVTFEVTYSNKDLVWLGDPASPTALVYPKPGARPIATDMHVTKLTESTNSPARRTMDEARIVVDKETRTVFAFTSNREQIIGTINKDGHFSPNDFYLHNHNLLPTWPVDASVLAYDPAENKLYYEVAITGPQISESLDFLPLELSDAKGKAVAGTFAIDFAPADKSPVVSLTFEQDGKSITLAKGVVPSVFRGSDVKLGSYDNKSGTYLPESAYRASTNGDKNTDPSVTFAFKGEFTPSVKTEGKSLIIDATSSAAPPNGAPAKITIDGNFDDWRNVKGVDDPRGDLVPYLEYVPDVDLLEFKVSHDDKHIYLYARVAGQVGRSHTEGGRGYFYAYMDVDQNPGTGFLPSRDDDCYFGVDIGDDCEVQFEFVNNAFRKTFYGFCGLGGDGNVLKKQVTIGKSQYGRLDEKGHEREDYKAEYTFRNGVTEITEDLKLGTSDTIQLAISPDGSEVEVVSDFTGFLQDPNGRPTLDIGRTIDVAVGMESDSKAYIGKARWGADNTIAIRGYKLVPATAGKK